ncbi:MAG TPA: hypothetical protein VHT97_08305 [Acidimicrobiales bacterium]|jgi:hypothetical protein|nr:hypothetical protein [Acidimicrobiales bacterium]
MDVYSSLIKQMSDARVAELRREATARATYRSARARSLAAARARFVAWLDRGRNNRRVTEPVAVAPAVALTGAAPAVDEELRRTA